jgi:hypothetical protein
LFGGFQGQGLSIFACQHDFHLHHHSQSHLDPSVSNPFTAATSIPHSTPALAILKTGNIMPEQPRGALGVGLHA